MESLKARVKNGRLTLDAPTSLPEGQVVDLQPASSLVVFEEPDDDLDEDERRELHAELEAALDEADAGETEDFSAALAALRSA